MEELEAGRVTNRMGKTQVKSLGFCTVVRVYLPVLLILLAPTIPYATATERLPNIVLVLVDELRYDEVVRDTRQEFVVLPNIDSLAKEGISFSNFYSVSTICSPNRASLLTGQYPMMHGVVDNTDRTRLSGFIPTFPQVLQENGYETAFIGKWHMGNDPSPRPGFDFWSALPGQGVLWNPRIWKDGSVEQVNGYVTDVLNEIALTFLKQPRDKPFLLYLSHKAIHPDARQNPDSSVDLDFGMRYGAAPEYAGKYDNEKVIFPKNSHSFWKDPNSKPVLKRALERKRSSEMADMWGHMLELDALEDTVRRRAEMLLSIDDGVGEIIRELKRQGEFDNTIVFFTSDNATNWGEHGLTIERRLPYETVIRLPLIAYYKGWSGKQGQTIGDLTLQIDIAPTVLAAAGVPIDGRMQGAALQPLVRGDSSAWRDAFIVEHRPDERPFPWILDLSFIAVRYQNLKLIHWLRYPEEAELYDLSSDPFEMNNVIHDDMYSGSIPALREKMNQLVLESRGL